MTTVLPGDDPEDPNRVALRGFRPRYPRWRWLFVPALMLAIAAGIRLFLVFGTFVITHVFVGD